MQKTYGIFHMLVGSFSICFLQFSQMHLKPKDKNVLELPKNHFKDVKKQLHIFHMLGGGVNLLFTLFTF